MKQTVLTIITEIDFDKKEQLEGILSAIQGNLLGNVYIPFSSLSLLHFCSFVIIDNPGGPSLLIFENNFDGKLSEYLVELLEFAGKGIDQLYKCCKAYHSDDYDPEKLKEFLIKNVVNPNAYHIGNVGRAAKVVGENRQLREKLEAYLDQLFVRSKPTDFPTDGIRKNIQAYLQDNVDPNLFNTLPPHQTFLERGMPWTWLTIAGLLAIIIVIALLPVFLLLVYILRRHEEADKPFTQPASLDHVDVLMRTENQISQNHLASITAIKPGVFRLILLKIVLFATNLLARTSNKGTLSGIPSIHFAHWSIINNKQLLFLSNFDGSWSSYLDDFIDKASRGLTGIWSNTVGFPKTRFLVLDGATDELAFKAFARGMQVPSLVWYSAYPDLTVQNIDKDSKIREGVLTDLSETDSKQWLKLF